MNKSPAFILLLGLCLLLGGCQGNVYGIDQREDEGPGYTDLISPGGQDIVAGHMPCTLYFGYYSEDFLVPVSTSIPIGTDETIEGTVISALIQGPSGDNLGFSRLINPATRVLKVQQQNGYLAITLSKEFLQDDGALRATDEKKQLAVQSIVNSIVELGLHSRVLILVDRSENNIGERLSYEEIGLPAMGSKAIEPLSADRSLVLTPEKALAICLQALVEGNYSRANEYIATTDVDGTAKASLQELQAQLEQGQLLGFELEGGAQVASSPLRCTVFASLSYASGNEITQHTSIPFTLLGEDIWRVGQSSLLNGLERNVANDQ